MADIFDSERGRITLVGIQGAQLTYNTLHYYLLSGSAPTVTEFTEDFNAYIAGYLTPAMSEVWTWVETRGRWFDLTSITEDTVSANTPGDVPGDVLPAYVTVDLSKFPVNTALEPSGGIPFRKGHIRLSGIPESFQTNGLLTAAAAALYEALADAMVAWSANGRDYVLHMYRPQGTIAGQPDTVAPVGAMGSPHMGTQNTRKL